MKINCFKTIFFSEIILPQPVRTTTTKKIVISCYGGSKKKQNLTNGSDNNNNNLWMTLSTINVLILYRLPVLFAPKIEQKKHRKNCHTNNFIIQSNRIKIELNFSHHYSFFVLFSFFLIYRNHTGVNILGWMIILSIDIDTPFCCSVNVCVYVSRNNYWFFEHTHTHYWYYHFISDLIYRLCPLKFSFLFVYFILYKLVFEYKHTHTPYLKLPNKTRKKRQIFFLVHKYNWP